MWTILVKIMSSLGATVVAIAREQHRKLVVLLYVCMDDNECVLLLKQVDITPIAEAAARHGLLLWEDCAQVFTGLQGYLGHPASDAVFFSFGVIKRATAFGGGVVRIGNKAILSGATCEHTGCFLW